ncbi:MAG: hypothetical protein ACI4XA_08845 [Oscillospiraceae bacterium]
MITYSICIENGKEYLICGENILEAVTNNIAYIEKHLSGCAIKQWEIGEAVFGDTAGYRLKIEYYDKTPCRLKRMKTKPRTKVAEFDISSV